MTHVEPRVAVLLDVPKEKKFSFRGVDLDALFSARARRRFQRGLTRKPMALIKKLLKTKCEAPPGEKPELVRAHLRNMITVPSKLRREINIEPTIKVTLSDDLFFKILLLLDVKSLLRLKCVSKSFNSLISDPFFVKMHLNKSSQNPHLIIDSSIYVHDPLTKGYIFQSSPNTSSFLSLFSKRKSRFHVFNPVPLCHFLEKDRSIIRAKDHTIYQLFANDCCEVVGSCDGLLCLVFHSLKEKHKYREFFLRFYNPATRSLSKKLAYFRASETDLYTIFRFSFGYDDLTAKYKVVAYCGREVRVFTLGDNNNSWRSIPSFPKAPYEGFGIYLSNSLNWLSLSNHTRAYHLKEFTIDQFVIISLDLGMETYMEFRPPPGFDEVPPFMPKISLLTGCLCFSYYSNENDFVIWKMREFGVQDSWIKLFKFSYEEPHSTQCGYFVPLHLFESDNSMIFATDQGAVVRYNSRENKVQNTRIYRNFSWYCGKHYVESLVSTC